MFAHVCGAAVLVLVIGQGPAVVQVGDVTAVYWPGDERLAVALAEFADRAGPWPGLPHATGRRVRIILAPNRRVFDSLTAGRLPEWGVAAALPAARTVILRRTGDLRRVVRHELAHLALHDAVRWVPRWFAEGYASRAADEWDRLDALRVNWALVRGATPSLAALDRHLREGGPAEAEAAYALATTAVLLLERLGRERGLEPLLTVLADTPDFDLALRTAHQITLGQFEALWQKELRGRYGWLLVFSSFTVFWAVMGVLLAGLWLWRRRRNRQRRAALDEGWVVPGDRWDDYA